MRSWKARLLILATMLAMLIALATPAMADDWEDVVEFCAEISDSEEEFEDCLEWFEDWDEDDEDDDDDW